MSTFKDRGIVLKEIKKNESDKHLVVLLKDRGLSVVYAKGALKPKSKLFAGTAIFSYCDFIIYEGNGFLTLSQVDIISSFHALSADYTNFVYAFEMIELIQHMIHPGMPCKNIMLLLIKTLHYMCTKNKPAELLAAIYRFKFMQIEGYQPSLSVCAICGESSDSRVYFGSNGMVCRSCLHIEPEKTIQIDDKTIYTIKYIIDNEIADLFNFSVPDEVVFMLDCASRIFLEGNIDVKLKSKL